MRTLHRKALHYTMMSGEPRSLGNHAAETLSFIRSAMERSSTFTAIPGAGGVIMGVVGNVAALVADRQPTPDRWLVTWLTAAGLAAVVGFWSLARKAHAAGLTLTGMTARRFALGMAAPFVAGAAITYALWVERNFRVMAPTWLLLYGAGLLTGGMFSVRVVRAIGACFMACGLMAILTPVEWGNWWLGAGFGIVQIVFGIHIARNYGG